MDKIAVLPGDGIGTEIMDEALKALNFVIDEFNLELEYEIYPVGGESIDKYGIPLTEETLNICKNSKAILLGAVGGPKWESTAPNKPRPEDALFKLRKDLGLFANLRPVKIYGPLVSSSTLKEEVLKDVDLLFVRELTGDVYFGKKERIIEDGSVAAYDTMIYRDYEIERIARLGFEVARARNRKVTSVEKSNVTESSRLWREIVIEVHKNYPDIDLNHMYVDNAAMQLVRMPRQFDVIVTSNMFGDILSDEAAMISGSIGLLPSASLRQDSFGMYEPIHGSAPDIAGQDIANPMGMILSVAMMFKYTFNYEQITKHIESAVNHVLEDGYRTRDIYDENKNYLNLVGTKKMGDLILKSMANF
jgi:3-isopropylmalate dehydrogenase